MHQRSNSENSFQILNKNNSFFLEEKVISNTNLTHKPMKHLKFDTTNIKFFVNESKALKFNHRHTKSLKSNASELDINNQNFPKLNKTFCDEEFKKYNQNFKSESEKLLILNFKEREIYNDENEIINDENINTDNTLLFKKYKDFRKIKNLNTNSIPFSNSNSTQENSFFSKNLEKCSFIFQPNTSGQYINEFKSSDDLLYENFDKIPQNNFIKNINIEHIPICCDEEKVLKNQRKKKKKCDNSEKYEIIIENILQDGRTTLMIKNIPNKYDQNLTLSTIDPYSKNKYDFFYLPIDFKNQCNVGYAFINFTDTKYIQKFFEIFNGRKWEKFCSEKICKIKYARIQGRNALLRHFQFSNVMTQQNNQLKPLIFPKSENSFIQEIIDLDFLEN